MKYCMALTVLGLLLAGSALTRGDGPPKPMAATAAWQLEFKFQTPQVITAKLPGEKEYRTFWYMLYTVTNRTGEDRQFAPTFTLFTETGQVLTAGTGVPAAAFNEIQKRHNNPLLVDPAGIAAKLLQGEDNARDGVAIFTDLDAASRAFEIFTGGLSDEWTALKLPQPITVTVTDEEGKTTEVQRSEVRLYKTLRVRYQLPGEPAARPRATPKLLAQEWVMR